MGLLLLLLFCTSVFANDFILEYNNEICPIYDGPKIMSKDEVLTACNEVVTKFNISVKFTIKVNFSEKTYTDGTSNIIYIFENGCTSSYCNFKEKLEFELLNLDNMKEAPSMDQYKSADLYANACCDFEKKTHPKKRMEFKKPVFQQWCGKNVTISHHQKYQLDWHISQIYSLVRKVNPILRQFCEVNLSREKKLELKEGFEKLSTEIENSFNEISDYLCESHNVRSVMNNFKAAQKQNQQMFNSI